MVEETQEIIDKKSLNPERTEKENYNIVIVLKPIVSWGL